MALTQAELVLVGQNFSISNQAHIDLLESKLGEFEKQYRLLKSQGYKIGLAAIGAYVTRLFGLTTMVCPTDWACVAYAVHVIHQSGVINQQYRDAFADSKAMFDWCFPNGAKIAAESPLAVEPSIQRLVENVGPLLSNTRRSRLEMWKNGSADSSGVVQNLVNSAGSAMKGVGSWAYSSIFGASKTAAASKKVMQPEVFAYLVRQLVDGKATSSVDYYCYGEGSELFSGAYNKAVELCSSLPDPTSLFKAKAH